MRATAVPISSGVTCGYLRTQRSPHPGITAIVLSVKAWILRIAVCLVLGMITTLAVAWACAWWINAGQGDFREGWHDAQQTEWMRGWRITRRDAFGANRVVAMARGTVPVPPKAPIAILTREELVPWWSNLSQVMDEQVRAVHAQESTRRAQGDKTTVRPTVLFDDARGWPLPALRCRWDHGLVPGGPEGGEILQGGIELEPANPQQMSSLSIDDQRALPYWPIWRGLAVDTSFYATILFVLLGGIDFTRRELRRVRGRCIKCGYDLRGDFSTGCSECGWGRENGRGAVR